MDNGKKQRLDRLAQQRHRGSRRSYVTEIENLQVLLAWEAGELSEGQVATVLKMDRVSVRELRREAVRLGSQRVEQK